MKWRVYRLTLPQCARDVLNYLTSQMGSEQYCRPSVERIASVVRYSERQVRRSIKLLVQENYITVDNRDATLAKKGTPIYMLKQNVKCPPNIVHPKTCTESEKPLPDRWDRSVDYYHKRMQLVEQNTYAGSAPKRSPGDTQQIEFYRFNIGKRLRCSVNNAVQDATVLDVGNDGEYVKLKYDNGNELWKSVKRVQFIDWL